MPPQWAGHRSISNFLLSPAWRNFQVCVVGASPDLSLVSTGAYKPAWGHLGVGAHSQLLSDYLGTGMYPYVVYRKFNSNNNNKIPQRELLTVCNPEISHNGPSING